MGPRERALLTEHVPAPEGGRAARALEVGCGTGELAAALAAMGYDVDAVDFTQEALIRARAQYAAVREVRFLCLDVEHDELPDPPGETAPGYDLITMRLCIAFIHDRTRLLHALGTRLREGGALVVITPVAEHTPEARRHIAPDEDELSLLADGFDEAERFDAEGLALLVLRGPGGSFTAVEKLRPAPQAVLGATAVVTNQRGPGSAGDPLDLPDLLGLPGLPGGLRGRR
ncbi:class I SAM-dependent methyltransferase [Streptomyces sp. A0958]|uniref:class I SAM-dependent methyltransferase n=1 Tax=Streptomyces sp. A0958 TaxID=2563101 RepID=UPI001F0F2E89|nr:class I SAM-dependent methyltransferase [Streptomyces sp. A0958]